MHEHKVRGRLLDHRFWQYTEERRLSYQQKWAAERRVKGRSGFIASNSLGVTAKSQVKKWVAEVGLQDRAERGRMSILDILRVHPIFTHCENCCRRFRKRRASDA